MYCTWKNTKYRKSKTIISTLKNRPFESLQHRTMQSSSYSLLNPEVQTKAAAPLPEGRAKATKGCYEESTLEKNRRMFASPSIFQIGDLTLHWKNCSVPVIVPSSKDECQQTVWPVKLS